MTTQGVVGWERVGTTLPYIFLLWESVPIPFYTSNGS